MPCFYLRQGFLTPQLCPQPHAHEACTAVGQDEDPEMVIHVSSDGHSIMRFSLVTYAAKSNVNGRTRTLVVEAVYR